MTMHDRSDRGMRAGGYREKEICGSNIGTRGGEGWKSADRERPGGGQCAAQPSGIYCSVYSVHDNATSAMGFRLSSPIAQEISKLSLY